MRLLCSVSYSLCRLISIHAPVKGATQGDIKNITIDAISIHAPVKGATRCRADAPTNADMISIHAPVKGATSRSTTVSSVSNDFNPRTREGCDSIADSDRMYQKRHFNPRTREGCDKRSSSNFFGITDFNPRTREGCDMTTSFNIYCAINISIHAPVKGATTCWYSTNRRPSNFNPRTREGCDSLQIGSVTICSLINHIAN